MRIHEKGVPRKEREKRRVVLESGQCVLLYKTVQPSKQSMQTSASSA